MSSINADTVLELAASTALPSQANPHETGIPTRSPRRFTRSQVIVAGTTKVANLYKPSQIKRKTGSKRAPDFAVFVDPLTSTEGQTADKGPALKRSKIAPRLALSNRSIASANSTPMPSPRTPDTPFTFSVGDPLWENVENYEPRPATPLLLPSLGMSPANTPFVTTPSVGPLPRRSTRTARVRRPSIFTPATPILPRNMELYTMLGISDVGADSEEIRTAYRRAALEQHPDRANEEDRGEATLRMQQLNAARDLLLNEDSRRQYHRDGQVPWADIV
ncbi:DnaJ-domain-containing protein [Plenodomus tracheiphilus IPT5]|uniref:DnaJ-domain-containing protein n=1 Tax=Plenodomus tracheiphilus IPT5 TaxID=1408161 RepID=A0A6A7B342_9PLEO|nr:DnaJ-domain-containing protein [Plenodomus tracheiphilus IPT5]